MKCLVEAMTAEMSTSTSHDVEGKIFCLGAMFTKGESPDLEDNLLLTFKANADPDTMYMYEALKEPDRAQFIKAMLKELSDQKGNVTRRGLSSKSGDSPFEKHSAEAEDFAFHIM